MLKKIAGAIRSTRISSKYACYSVCVGLFVLFAKCQPDKIKIYATPRPRPRDPLAFATDTAAGLRTSSLSFFTLAARASMCCCCFCWWRRARYRSTPWRFWRTWVDGDRQPTGDGDATYISDALLCWNFVLALRRSFFCFVFVMNCFSGKKRLSSYRVIIMPFCQQQQQQGKREEGMAQVPHFWSIAFEYRFLFE